MVHLAAALIRLLSFVTEVELPYPLVLRPLGFEIMSAAGESYPLYVLTEQPGGGQEADLKKSAKLSLTDQAIKLKLTVQHEVLFEFGATLLDQNIQYLLSCYRFKLKEGDSRLESKENPFLNIESLRRQCLL